MGDTWLFQGLMPLLGGVVFLGLARRPPWRSRRDAAPSPGDRVLQFAVAGLGAAWLLGALVWFVGRLTGGS